MSVRRHRAFTLTEMLVVISIIGVLVSMLLPAVQAAREASRQAVCQSNMRQCGHAIITYESKKGFLPAARTYISNSAIQNWVVPVLPMLERTDLSDTIRSAGGDPSSVQAETIPILLCPDDPDIKNPGVLNYVVNGGRQNAAYKDNTNTTFQNSDFLANGLLIDKGVTWASKTAHYMANLDKSPLDQVRDGVSTTILLAENMIAGTRDQTGTASIFWALAATEQQSQVLWFPDITGSDFIGLNQDTTATGTIPADKARYARPASFHPGGFMVCFADGSVRFMADVVDYKIYAVLMTSRGAQQKEPSTGTADSTCLWQDPTNTSPGYPGTKF